MERLAELIAGHGVDRRYLGLCLVGAVVSASAACAVLIGQVPVDAVPAGGLLAAACAILAVEWLFAAALLVIRADRPAGDASAVQDQPSPAPELDTGAVRGPEAGADSAALQDRIEQLTAALTLAAAAENLQDVGALVEDALAADLRRAAGVSSGERHPGQGRATPLTTSRPAAPSRPARLPRKRRPPAKCAGFRRL